MSPLSSLQAANEGLVPIGAILPLELSEEGNASSLAGGLGRTRRVRWDGFVIEDLDKPDVGQVYQPLYDRSTLELQENTCAIPAYGTCVVEDDNESSSSLGERTPFSTLVSIESVPGEKRNIRYREDYEETVSVRTSDDEDQIPIRSNDVMGAHPMAQYMQAMLRDSGELEVPEMVATSLGFPQQQEDSLCASSTRTDIVGRVRGTLVCMAVEDGNSENDSHNVGCRALAFIKGPSTSALQLFLTLDETDDEDAESFSVPELSDDDSDGSEESLSPTEGPFLDPSINSTSSSTKESLSTDADDDDAACLSGF